jgi:hypothetical protein
VSRERRALEEKEIDLFQTSFITTAYFTLSAKLHSSKFSQLKKWKTYLSASFPDGGSKIPTTSQGQLQRQHGAA